MGIVELEGLSRRFAALTAVDELTLSIDAGEVFGLLGPNGAGKTTTIKMLTTLLPPSAGSARIDGRDVVREAASVRRLIGYVPQMLSADGTLTGFENLLVFSKLYELPRRDRRRLVLEALEFMGLADSADKLVRQYSGGMIRRLEIAQSLLHSPRVLFLDEPTVGLDPAARRAALAELPRGAFRPRMRNPLAVVASYIGRTLAIAGMEARKLAHDPTEIITRAVQPALWLLVFGQVFTRVRAIPTGSMRYIDFMAPGILSQSVLFIAIFYGISVIWERDLGILHKFLVTPTPRTALVLGKALSAGVRGLTQAVIVYLLAVLLGVGMDWRPLPLLGVLLTVLLGASFFSTFSLVIACLVKTRERFMGIGQVLTMPLFFASNAIYPISIMPGWLQAVSHANPLTYQVDALRALMLSGGTSSFGIGTDLGVLVFATAVLVTICSWLYPKIVI